MTALTEQAKAIAEGTADVEWKHPSLASALVAALADLTVIEPKNSADMGSFKVRYADLASLVKLTRKPLADHGLVVLTPLCHLNDSPAVQVTIVHEAGETMTFGPFPFQHGRDAQATGSWVTYMRRYALVAALGMAAGDDDDGAAGQPLIPWTKADAKNRLVAAVGKDNGKAAWDDLDGETHWKDWEHGFPQADVDAWINAPKDQPAPDSEGEGT